MTREKIMVDLFEFSAPTYYKCTKHQQRKIFNLLNYAFSDEELLEYLTTNKIQRIEKEKNYNQLEVYNVKINDFRAENFKILEDFKAKAEAKKTGTTYQQSVTINVANEMPPTTIETPEQLEVYITKLREKLMIKLAKNQKIFLN